jgi:hypothetical protein
MLLEVLMMKKIIMLLMVLVSMIGIVSAVQSQQSTSKIFLNPFYLNSMSSGDSYSYNLTVNPPDGAIQANITNANIDELINIQIIYLTNGVQ